MKSKIILLLVLLIPSLCFGETLKIEIRNSYEEKLLHVGFTSSKYNKHEVFTFKTHNLNKIIISDNKEEWGKFQLYLFNVKMFPIIVNSAKIIPVVFIQVMTERNAIYANWQITHRELTENLREMTLYLYKPDK